jgi:hypothetical protein
MNRLPALTALLLVVAASACSADGVTSSGDAVCATVADHDGRRYHGHGDLTRTPETTGRTVEVLLPGCDDGNGAAEDRTAEAEELTGVPLARAFLVDGQVYVRGDAPLPDEVQAWFLPARCATAGPFEISGPWVGVRSRHEPRFDGDLRAPYRVEMWVEAGPEEYVGTRVTVRADEETTPGLGPRDVERSLWEGGDVVAQVRCEDGRFVADGLRT